MRPAIAIGAALDGERLEREAPWRVACPWAEVEFVCRWPSGPSALRGAVVAAVPEPHVDLHGHLEDGSTRQARATVCYRVRGRTPLVWAYGPRAVDHAHQIARVRELVAPAGGRVVVDEAHVLTGRLDVGVEKERWRSYELRTPYFPSAVAYARRPRAEGPEQVAWAGQALASSMRLWMEGLGLAVETHRPVHVQVTDYRAEMVRWRDRREAVRSGFVARFVSNAILPPGVGLGQHIAEGFGEVRPC